MIGWSRLGPVPSAPLPRGLSRAKGSGGRAAWERKVVKRIPSKGIPVRMAGLSEKFAKMAGESRDLTGG